MDVDSSTEDSSKIKVENCSNDLRSTYSFESDSLALKENTDYQQLLRTICVLEAQRSQALEDIDMLLENIHAVQQDPEGFVEKLQCGKLPRLPEPQQVAELPHIEWERYTGNLELNLVRSRQSVRLKKQNIEVKSISQLKSHLITGTEGYVRGRLKDKDKCPTFNQLWTEEEQCRLDELLRKYPPEEVEAQRWKKIAADLGNRTPAQVASRVQKYFYKLEKNHLPIPGRVPNRASSAMRHRRMRRRRGGIFGSTSSWQSSTFLRSYRPLVNIDSADNPGIGTYTGFNAKYPTEVAPPVHTKVTDLDDMAMLKDCQEMKDLQELLNQRKAKISSLDPSVQVHCHFQCDRCRCSPIVGGRYHCVDCPAASSVDFCDMCYPYHDSIETTSHNSSHRIRRVNRVWGRPTHDKDYMTFDSNTPGGHHNYLDPNYMPAV